jgi:hypothetical protein
MPKTLTQVLLDVDNTVRRSEGISLQSATMLQEAMKTPIRHNSSRQKGRSQKTDRVLYKWCTQKRIQDDREGRGQGNAHVNVVKTCKGFTPMLSKTVEQSTLACTEV